MLKLIYLSASLASMTILFAAAGSYTAEPAAQETMMQPVSEAATDVKGRKEETSAGKHAKAAERLFRKYNPFLPLERARLYGSIVATAAAEFRIDAALIAAVIVKESSAKESARSKYASGLMQVNYRVWKNQLAKWGIGSEKELMEPQKNIRAGTKILKGYLERSNWNTSRALQRYYGGKSSSYVESVLKYRREFNLLLRG